MLLRFIELLLRYIELILHFTLKASILIFQIIKTKLESKWFPFHVLMNLVIKQY